MARGFDVDKRLECGEAESWGSAREQSHGTGVATEIRAECRAANGWTLRRSYTCQLD